MGWFGTHGVLPRPAGPSGATPNEPAVNMAGSLVRSRSHPRIPYAKTRFSFIPCRRCDAFFASRRSAPPESILRTTYGVGEVGENKPRGHAPLEAREGTDAYGRRCGTGDKSDVPARAPTPTCLLSLAGVRVPTIAMEKDDLQ